MLQRFFFITFLLTTIFQFQISAQNAVIKGKITDIKTNDPLVGASVIVRESQGTITDINGDFSIEVEPGSYKVTFRYVGYEEKKIQVEVKAGETKEMNVSLSESAEELDLVVVSGSKYSRKLPQETVSIEVLKSDLIQNTNSVTLSDAVDKVAGVEIFDNQVTIRGGAGYSFGVGSRVLMLIDEMPLLSVDRNEIRWNFVPLEILEQVEVLKSASSTLYGASALNGVISAQTAWPKDKPETKATLYYTGYAKPKNENAAWWTYAPFSPYRYGGTFAHLHRFKSDDEKTHYGTVDLVVGANLNKSVGYIRLLDPYHARLSFKMRHMPKKAPGLSYGLLCNFMDSREGDYLYWADSDSGAFIPSGSNDYDEKGSLVLSHRKTLIVDPWVKYFDKFGNKHLLRGRYNYIDVQFTSVPNPYSHMLLGEYQFQRAFKFGLNIIAGVQEQLYILKDPRDLGERQGTIFSVYAQANYGIKRFNFTLGGRYEQYTLDKQGTRGRPLFSAGLNYQPGKTTYLRASFGQGLRLPSIAEKFVIQKVQEGPPKVYILPNDSLDPEYGFNSEIGIKQGIKISNWKAYLDYSFFWYEYWDMIEFNPHPLVLPDLGFVVGFTADNITRARIAGMELSVYGEGKIWKIPIKLQGGYTYNYPVNLSNDTTLNNFGKYMGYFFRSLTEKPRFVEALEVDSNEVTAPILKYRSRHLFKSDVEFGIWHFILGIDARYYSYVEKVDAAFTLVINDIDEFREQHHGGDWILDIRAGYDFAKFGKLMLLINNATNKFYTIRPARMEPPLNFTVQYSIKI